MDILGIFESLFSSVSTSMKIKNSDDSSVNDKVNDIINNKNEINIANEINKRRLQLKKNRKQHKAVKEFNKNR